MPESKKRKRDVYASRPLPSAARRRKPSPPWVAPLMLLLFAVGIVWLVVYYSSSQVLPFSNGADILVGFGFIVAGFAVATQWR